MREWEYTSPIFLQEALKLMVKDNIGKEAPENGVLKTLPSGYKEHGYQNIAAFIIRFPIESKLYAPPKKKDEN